MSNKEPHLTKREMKKQRGLNAMAMISVKKGDTYKIGGGLYRGKPKTFSRNNMTGDITSSPGRPFIRVG